MRGALPPRRRGAFGAGGSAGPESASRVLRLARVVSVIFFDRGYRVINGSLASTCFVPVIFFDPRRIGCQSGSERQNAPGSGRHTQDNTLEEHGPLAGRA
jgi:hypothetical protein